MASHDEFPRERPARSGSDTAAKVTVTLRIPADILGHLRAEAAKRQWSLNEYVVTVLDDFLSLYSIEPPSLEPLEADQKALGLASNRRQYFQWLVRRRVEAVREKGPGFDKWDPKGVKTPDRK